jgi:hypothetical protein
MRASREVQQEVAVAAAPRVPDPTLRRFVIIFAVVEALIIGGAILAHLLRKPL